MLFRTALLTAENLGVVFEQRSLLARQSVPVRIDNWRAVRLLRPGDIRQRRIGARATNDHLALSTGHVRDEILCSLSVLGGLADRARSQDRYRTRLGPRRGERRALLLGGVRGGGNGHAGVVRALRHTSGDVIRRANLHGTVLLEVGVELGTEKAEGTERRSRQIRVRNGHLPRASKIRAG